MAPHTPALTDAPQYERATVDEEHNFKLVDSIERNAQHYIEILSRAVDTCLPPPTRDLKYASVSASASALTAPHAHD